MTSPEALVPYDEEEARRQTRAVVLRDGIFFQLKLAADGLKDLVLFPAGLIAMLWDVLSPTKKPGQRLYGLLRVGARFDKWLGLFEAGERPEHAQLGPSGAGADALLAKAERRLSDEIDKLSKTE